MITGIYRFYCNDELVAEQKNALTENGRTIAIKSLLELRRLLLVQVPLLLVADQP